MKQLRLLIKMILVTLSPRYAKKNAERYWKNTTVTHGFMSNDSFNFYYRELNDLTQPKKGQTILDYGGGNGEIAQKFLNDGITASCCDINLDMVNNAKARGVNSFLIEDINSERDTYDIIIINNAFFYVHPTEQEKVIAQLFNKLSPKGKLYITDTPDFSSRAKVEKWYHRAISSIFPVIQPNTSGFWVKNHDMERIANSVGFKSIKKEASWNCEWRKWSDYRSHWIFSK